MSHNTDLMELAEKVARTACLDQRIGNRCVCLSCEAKRVILKMTNMAQAASDRLDRAWQDLGNTLHDGQEDGEGV